METSEEAWLTRNFPGLRCSPCPFRIFSDCSTFTLRMIDRDKLFGIGILLHKKIETHHIYPGRRHRQIVFQKLVLLDIVQR